CLRSVASAILELLLLVFSLSRFGYICQHSTIAVVVGERVFKRYRGVENEQGRRPRLQPLPPPGTRFVPLPPLSQASPSVSNRRPGTDSAPCCPAPAGDARSQGPLRT